MTDPLIPDDRRYGPEHEWTFIDEHGVVVVGITDYAQDQLGDIQYIDFPQVETGVTRGSPLLEIESTKSVSEVYAPVSGVVVEINESLVGEPEHVNGDPYNSWLCRIKHLDLTADLAQLSTAEQYRTKIEG